MDSLHANYCSPTKKLTNTNFVHFFEEGMKSKFFKIYGLSKKFPAKKNLYSFKHLPSVCSECKDKKVLLNLISGTRVKEKKWPKVDTEI